MRILNASGLLGRWEAQEGSEKVRQAKERQPIWMWAHGAHGPLGSPGTVWNMPQLSCPTSKEAEVLIYHFVSHWLRSRSEVLTPPDVCPISQRGEGKALRMREIGSCSRKQFPGVWGMWGTREGKESSGRKSVSEQDKREQVLPVSGNFPGKRNSKNRCPEVGTCRAYEQMPLLSGAAKGGKVEGIGSHCKDSSQGWEEGPLEVLSTTPDLSSKGFGGGCCLDIDYDY